MSDSSIRQLIEAIGELGVGRVNLMEVCGTHTMAIARGGIKSVLPENVRLISGPGCPVCVTPAEVMDAVLELAAQSDISIMTYGDMVRVPGSRRGITLRSLRGAGCDVNIVYSPMDAVEAARRNPGRQIVFLGAGFETTAPGTAVAVKMAAQEGLDNFTIFSMLKMVEPALRALIADPEFNVQGFICPGHVATIIGEKGFEFLPKEFNLPGVISGFEPEDILVSIYRLLKQKAGGTARIENEYSRAVSAGGNTAALKIIDEMFEARDDLWRGLGNIPQSGLKLKEKYRYYDAEDRFSIKITPSDKPTSCRCGDVIQGKISPRDCPMFGMACTPEDPAGPCMVSGEGACAAGYKYGV